ncbi:flagellar hook-basal body complex protein FliE [Massilia sp. Dwa41.01b]|uniref:flagellar hook-basal body complex protein FliE n=1 Tax=unclassified Massilia TaxID=2609279 RepID=UPI0016010F0B|nr:MULTISPECIES: flagellar hook-basal body complex protein FliE [unclassified Massilia]QNA88216.1 flagellar hook-basal body complex protein FliE [Massilia sp. Dwa41.01b]QNA99116.1 flagellar hook-basal body complex protein FliE [Massilia sp. Se16.2.3]
MGIELAGQIKADLAALTNEAQRIANAPSIAPSIESTAQSGHAEFSFSDTMKNALHSVDAEDQAAAVKMADVDSGKSDDLVGAMLASQQASLSFSMLMQVRNKVMGAVDELIKLPV